MHDMMTGSTISKEFEIISLVFSVAVTVSALRKNGT